MKEDLRKSLLRVQLAAASFVLGRFAEIRDIDKLGWQPVVERRQDRLLNMTSKFHLRREHFNILPRSLGESIILT